MSCLSSKSFVSICRHGKIPEKLRTLQYFGQSWFKSTFLPTILSLEEEQKHTPLPDFKDIHLFVKGLNSIPFFLYFFFIYLFSFISY